MNVRTIHRKLLQLAITLSFPLAVTNSVAQSVDDYPSSAITMIVGWAAGGPADGVARLVASEMSKHLGQSIVIENKGGAGGNIGAPTP